MARTEHEIRFPLEDHVRPGYVQELLDRANHHDTHRPDADEHWGVADLTRNRDADVLERCNFQVITDDLRARYPKSIRVQRYRHWAVGWVEWVHVNTRSRAAVAAAYDWEQCLKDYAVADETAYSAAQQADRERQWDDWGQAAVESGLAGDPDMAFLYARQGLDPDVDTLELDDVQLAICKDNFLAHLYTKDAYEYDAAKEGLRELLLVDDKRREVAALRKRWNYQQVELFPELARAWRHAEVKREIAATKELLARVQELSPASFATQHAA